MLGEIKKTLSAVAAVWAIIFASPAEAGPDGGSGLGAIIVYRPWSLLSSCMEFNVNHWPDLLVRNGTYYRVSVPPGENIISHDDMPFLSTKMSKRFMWKQDKPSTFSA